MLQKICTGKLKKYVMLIKKTAIGDLHDPPTRCSRHCCRRHQCGDAAIHQTGVACSNCVGGPRARQSRRAVGNASIVAVGILAAQMSHKSTAKMHGWQVSVPTANRAPGRPMTSSRWHLQKTPCVFLPTWKFNISATRATSWPVASLLTSSPATGSCTPPRVTAPMRRCDAMQCA